MWKAQNCILDHTTSSSSHNQRVWRIYSGILRHISWVGSEITIWQTKFIFVGSKFWHALQIKFFTLLGTRRDQIPSKDVYLEAQSLHVTQTLPLPSKNNNQTCRYNSHPFLKAKTNIPWFNLCKRNGFNQLNFLWCKNTINHCVAPWPCLYLYQDIIWEI